MNSLKKHGCTIENILATDDEILVELISVVNYRNKKVVYIKKVSKIIMEKYNGKVPYKLED